MTTKHKIISGFALMIAIIILLAVVGYKSLDTSSNTFTEYSHLARLNVLASGIETSQTAAALSMAHFLRGFNPSHVDLARKSLEMADSQAEEALTHINNPEHRQALEHFLADTNAYKGMIDRIRNGISYSSLQYREAIAPASDALFRQLLVISNGVTERDDTGLSNMLSEMFVTMSRMQVDMAAYTESLDETRESSVFALLDTAKAALEKFRAQATSALDKERFAALQKNFDALSSAFAAQNRALHDTLDIMRKMYELNGETSALVQYLNQEINAEMQVHDLASRLGNAEGQKVMTALSMAGVVFGIACALLITAALIRVLTRAAAFAEAVAAGNFAYAHGIREGGEIGGMLKAIGTIPALLKIVVERCNALANNIATGSFRARLDETQLRGEFKYLAVAVNTVARSYTDVLDNLPCALITGDTNRKMQFLNKAAQRIAGGNDEGAFCGDKLRTESCRDNARCFGSQCLGNECQASGETAVRTGCQYMHFSVFSAPLYDISGNLSGYIEIFNDITTLKTQEAAMLRVAEGTSSASDHLAAATEELPIHAKRIARGPETQRCQRESTASAVNEMIATVFEMARNAAKASVQSENSLDWPRHASPRPSRLRVPSTASISWPRTSNPTGRAWASRPRASAA